MTKTTGVAAIAAPHAPVNSTPLRALHFVQGSDDLAGWSRDAGDAVGARDQFAALLGDELGSHHPDTLKTGKDLIYWIAEAGTRSGQDLGSKTLPSERFGGRRVALGPS